MEQNQFLARYGTKPFFAGDGTKPFILAEYGTKPSILTWDKIMMIIIPNYDAGKNP